MNNNFAWDQDVRIGSAVRGNGQSSGPKQGVARSNAAINQAKRTGTFVGAEKKFATGNAAKGNTMGQRETKIDRSDDIVKPLSVGPVVGSAITQARNALKQTQKELAAKCFITQPQLALFEQGKAAPDQKVLGALERALKVKLRGSDIGMAIGGPKKPTGLALTKGKKKGNNAKEEKAEETPAEEKPAEDAVAEEPTTPADAPKADGEEAQEQK